MDEYEKGASKILAHIEAVYVPTHAYVQADPNHFRHLNLKFYAAVLAELQAKGFRHLQDIEDKTISNAPGSVLKRIMIRSMLSESGTVMGSAYDVKLKPLWWLLLFILRKVPGPVVDLETEYSDGAFLVTSNAESAASINSPPLILTEYFPKRTAISLLLKCHLQRMDAYSQVAGVQPKSFVCREDIIRSQNRMNAIKSAYRNELGGITADELASFFGKHSEFVKQVHEKVVEIRGQAA